jgi:hypothetical protein
VELFFWEEELGLTVYHFSVGQYSDFIFQILKYGKSDSFSFFREAVFRFYFQNTETRNKSRCESNAKSHPRVKCQKSPRVKCQKLLSQVCWLSLTVFHFSVGQYSDFIFKILNHGKSDLWKFNIWVFNSTLSTCQRSHLALALSAHT